MSRSLLIKGAYYIAHLIIIDSKKTNSNSWEGTDYQIKNTPQQGINWIGNLPYTKAVIVKKNGGYSEDYIKHEDSDSCYAFKGKKGVINKSEKANQVLIKQINYKYPIIELIETGKYWTCVGLFDVIEEYESYVSMKLR